MGYDVNRFEERVDEELICPICVSVLENPLQAPKCEHAFCEACIKEWLTRQASCPVDRATLISSELRPAPRILRNLLGRLQIHCENQRHGCNSLIRLDVLEEHQQQCEHNPKKLTPCPNECGAKIPKDELANHNCVRDARALALQNHTAIQELRRENNELKRALQQMVSEQQGLRDLLLSLDSGSAATTSNSLSSFIRVLAHTQPTGAVASDSAASSIVSSSPLGAGLSTSVSAGEDVEQWVSTLPHARVTRWGGMISTPDAVLQAIVRRALIDSRCPGRILNDLMECSHERRWPPGRQAVVVMAVENGHMSSDLIAEPGLIMIFAHGVE